MKVTPRGLEVLRFARTSLREIEKIHQVASVDIKEFSGDLKIGIIPTIAPYLIPLFVISFKEVSEN